MGRVPILLLCFAVAALSGCATMSYPGAYKVEGVEVKEFKELNDDRALKIIALIYNVNCQAWEDGIARSITLEEYLKLLTARKSKYIKDSGVFDIKYEKVKIASWKDDDLFRLYDALEPKTGKYYMDSAPELTEIENAKRIMYLTAVNAVVRELKIRDGKRTALSIVSQVLLTALSAALSMI